MAKKQGTVKSTPRDLLRSVTVGAPKNFKTEIIEFEGQEFELRQPSIKVLQTIAEKSESDGSVGMIDLGIWGMILCTYVPGTNDLVFEEGDYKEIISHPKSKFIEELSSKAIELISIDPVVMEKN